jgi:hypothetical protein
MVNEPDENKTGEVEDCSLCGGSHRLGNCPWELVRSVPCPLCRVGPGMSCLSVRPGELRDRVHGERRAQWVQLCAERSEKNRYWRESRRLRKTERNLPTMDVTEMARLGGKARAAKLSAKERSMLAREAARARWGKMRKRAKRQ